MRRSDCGPSPARISSLKHVDALLAIDRKEREQRAGRKMVRVRSGREYTRLAKEAEELGITVEQLRQRRTGENQYYNLRRLSGGERSLNDLENLDQLERELLPRDEI